MIERGTPGGGSPRFDANDRYFLDGIELMDCTSQGGTHCTRIQNYSRIVKNTNDTWTVTGTNGNVATYQTIQSTPGGTFRWFLSSIRDPRGNSVQYSYWTDGSPSKNLYLDRISYNGTEIQFYRQARTDPVTYAAGATLGEMNYRLSGIDVKVISNRLRYYGLSYAVSDITNQSLVAGVRQWT